MDENHLSADKESAFPNLRREEYQVTSDEDWSYNCIAFAAGNAEAWWWPTTVESEGVFWPQNAPTDETLDAFVAAFGTLGYLTCDNEEAEDGFEKVAIYADSDGRPTHAAKQLTNGRWTSKLGRWEDIEHKSLDAVACPTYGRPAVFLKRRINHRKL